MAVRFCPGLQTGPDYELCSCQGADRSVCIRFLSGLHAYQKDNSGWNCLFYCHSRFLIKGNFIEKGVHAGNSNIVNFLIIDHPPPDRPNIAEVFSSDIQTKITPSLVLSIIQSLLDSFSRLELVFLTDLINYSIFSI